MHRGAVARALLAFLVVAAPVAAFAVSVPEPTPADYTGPPVESLGERLGIDERTPAATTVDDEVEVIIELKQGAAVPRARLSVERVYTRRGARRLHGRVALDRVRELSQDPRIEAIRIERRGVGVDTSTAAGVEAVGADALHARSVRGDNVTVGVIDRGFRPSDPEIAGHVGAYRSFDGDDEWVHGTAVASVVADTAPNATLHLASVGPTTTPEEYRRAVEWLEASGADVIVDAGSYFGQPGDGSGAVARIAATTAEETVFVAAAGNYGNRHWEGTDDGGHGEWVSFGSEQGNALAAGEPMSGEVNLALRWDDSAADYDLYLMRIRPGDDEVVARSATRQTGDGAPVERVDARVPRGRYYVAVQAHDASGSHELELFTNRRLSAPVANGSITAPATARSVLAVGAYENGSVAPFSSRGPVGEHTGVDLVAPDSVAATSVTDGEGTSYAAPYVAGTAALLVARYPSLTPGQVRTILTASARDVGPAGPDVAAGNGLVDARTAYVLAGDRVRYSEVNRTST
ncbi:S8 family serine peptidase [Halorarius halobius]|uniref:S8 family serine peptidase n=1 Tax=Halorarius halobius TaxID=2962671 RepID=UPI0020CDA428|nr:S8 family serine peptidase [Halorarius halobius]